MRINLNAHVFYLLLYFFFARPNAILSTESTEKYCESWLFILYSANNTLIYNDILTRGYYYIFFDGVWINYYNILLK